MRIRVNEVDLYIDVEGAQLRAGTDGLIERPTVVVLHGGPGFDQGYLRPGLGPLSAYAQLVFVDLRSQGRSGRAPVETCTLEQMADDVADLCDQLGIGAPVVLGHSAGGFVALHLALRRPSSVGGLILCSTAPTLAPIADGARPPSLADRASAESIDAAQRLFGGDFSEESFDAFTRLVAPFYAGPRHTDVPHSLFSLSSFAADVAAGFFPSQASSYDLRPRLPEVSVPTLVMVGGFDWVCPPAGSRFMAAHIAGARLVEVAEAGHFIFSEEPDEFRAAVAAFLDSLTPTTPAVQTTAVPR